MQTVTTNEVKDINNSIRSKKHNNHSMTINNFFQTISSSSITPGVLNFGMQTARKPLN